MTRFMMTLDDAVDLVLYAFEHGHNGDIFVQKAPAATVQVLTQALLELMGKPDHAVRVIGTRHGEKLYEALLSREEMACAEDLGDYFRVPPDGRDLNYAKFVEQGEQRLTQALHGDEYNSHNTTRLDVPGMKALLLKLHFMQRIARGEHGHGRGLSRHAHRHHRGRWFYRQEPARAPGRAGPRRCGGHHPCHAARGRAGRAGGGRFCVSSGRRQPPAGPGRVRHGQCGPDADGVRRAGRSRPPRAAGAGFSAPRRRKTTPMAAASGPRKTRCAAMARPPVRRCMCFA